MRIITYNQLLTILPNRIFVDLDGTLIKQELVREQFMRNIVRNPFLLLKYFYKGKLLSKLDICNQIRQGVSIQHGISAWTYNLNLVRMLQFYFGQIIIITGSCQLLAQQIAYDLYKTYNIKVHKVVGSTRYYDCLGLNKLKIMHDIQNSSQNIVDQRAFDQSIYNNRLFYIGNSIQDVPILQHCDGCLITTKRHLIKQLNIGRYWINI